VTAPTSTTRPATANYTTLRGTTGPGGVGLVQVALQLGMLLMILPFAVRVGWDALGLRRLPASRDRLVLMFPTLTVVVGFFAGFRHVEVSTLTLAFTSVVLAGVVEETTFRGILLTRLLPRGPWTAVLLSSALFGLLHVANLFLGSPWQTVLLQVTFAAMAGTGYAAMRMRTGSLWPPVVLHALFDLTFRVTVGSGHPLPQRHPDAARSGLAYLRLDRIAACRTCGRAVQHLAQPFKSVDVTGRQCDRSADAISSPRGGACHPAALRISHSWFR